MTQFLLIFMVHVEFFFNTYKLTWRLFVTITELTEEEREKVIRWGERKESGKEEESDPHLDNRAEASLDEQQGVRVSLKRKQDEWAHLSDLGDLQGEHRSHRVIAAGWICGAFRTKPTQVCVHRSGGASKRGAPLSQRRSSTHCWSVCMRSRSTEATWTGTNHPDRRGPLWEAPGDNVVGKGAISSNWSENTQKKNLPKEIFHLVDLKYVKPETGFTGWKNKLMIDRWQIER